MPPESDAIPDELRRKLAQAGMVAKAVDDAIMKVEPTIFDLQVAVEGVKQLLNSLTVLEQGSGR
jgi:hypothetical protein